jgi:hypothetical protein
MWLCFCTTAGEEVHSPLDSVCTYGMLDKLVCTQFKFAYTVRCLYCYSSAQFWVSCMLSLSGEYTCLHTVHVGLLWPCLCILTGGAVHSPMDLVCTDSLIDNLVCAQFVFVYTTVPLSCCRRNSSQSCGSCLFSSSWETQASWLHFLSAKEGNLG